jgi:uncharacterized membrane protein
MAIAGGAMIIALPAVLIFRDRIVAELVPHHAPPEVVWAMVALIFLAFIAVVLGFYFFRHLRRIIGTVGDGDPFVPINAERLRAMGWITVAVHVIGIPMAALSGWIESVTDNLKVVFEVPLSGLLLAVVLFVLARVFREGTRMRDELEGTV